MNDYGGIDDAICCKTCGKLKWDFTHYTGQETCKCSTAGTHYPLPAAEWLTDYKNPTEVIPVRLIQPEGVSGDVLLTGWQCPLCKTIYSPYKDTCLCQIDRG